MRALISLGRQQGGTALVEFAMVAPVFLMMLLGIVSYGGYFWRAHAVQQAANDGARAALAGLTAPERATLARTVVRTQLASLGGIDPLLAPTVVREAGETLIVQVDYDGSQDGFLKLGLVPLPATTIRRIAAVRLAGL